MKPYVYILSALLISGVFSCKTKQQTTSKDPKEPSVLLDTINILPELTPIVYRSSSTHINDLVHTKLDVRFDWSKQHLLGKAWITLTPHFYPTDSLTLDAKGFEITEVAVMNGAEKKVLTYDYNKKKIYIKLDKTYTRGEKYVISIDYTAMPNELPKGGSAAISNDKGLYFINPLGTEEEKPMQIWTQGETEANSCWFPTIDKPNAKMTQEISITIEKKYHTLSNGLLISTKENPDGTRTDTWKQDLPAAPYLTMMAIGEYALVKDKWKRPNGKEMDVHYYVEKDYESHAKAIFGNTPEMLTFFSKTLGVEYPWEKFAQIPVRDYVSGAMENTGAVIFGEFIQRTTRELLDRDGEDIIAHELFHHWFGDLTTCESWSNLPLNESFATYGEYMWIEYKYGREEADLHHYESYSGYISESSRKKEKLIRFDWEDKEDMFDGHSYNKGGQVLHMLRKLVGDDAFYASLKVYLDKNRFKSAEIHDLRLAFEEVTGQDLNWFFNQWFLSAGHPELTILHSYDEKEKKYTVTLKQVQDMKKSVLFRIPMTVDIYANGKVERKQIVMEKGKQDFVFDAPVRPDLVNVDGEKMLLCTRTELLSNKEWVFMYKNSKLYVDRSEALDNLAKKPSDPDAQEVILAALDDPFWDLRSYAIKKSSDIISYKRDVIREKMIKMAQSDPESSVRADALEFLSKNFSDASLTDVFKTALNDQSYAVLGRALSGLAKINPQEGLKLAAGLENEKSNSVLLTIASVYGEHGSDAQNDFFLRKASSFKGFGNIGFLNIYTQFLKKCSDETVIKGLPIFEKVAKQEGSKWVRYFGQKGVNDLIKHYRERSDKLKSKIRDVKEANPNATGLAKMEEELKQSDMMVEKLTVVYNGLVQ